MTYQSQTEAATSRFLEVQEAGETLRVHFNDCGQGEETVVLLHGSGLARQAGQTSAEISIRWYRPDTG